MTAMQATGLDGSWGKVISSSAAQPDWPVCDTANQPGMARYGLRKSEQAVQRMKRAWHESAPHCITFIQTHLSPAQDCQQLLLCLQYSAAVRSPTNRSAEVFQLHMGECTTPQQRRCHIEQGWAGPLRLRWSAMWSHNCSCAPILQTTSLGGKP